MPITIRTEITIEASPDSVTEILFDFHSYHLWNSWLSIVGPPKTNKNTFYLSLVGCKLLVDESDSQYESIIMMASPSVLTWTWYDIHKFCMVHQHFFEIIKDGDSCVFKHGERFSGGIAWARTFTQYYKKREALFEQFNKELKAHAESKDAVELVSMK